MPIVDHWANNRNRVEGQLQPGEQMLAFSAAGLSHGTVPEPPEQRSARGRVASFFVDALFGAVGDARKFERLVFGQAVVGSLDCLALQAYKAVSAQGNSLYIGVTDHRFLLFADDSDTDSDKPLPLVWQLPRQEVTGAVVRSRFLSFGRLQVRFRDGSAIEFVSLLLMGPTRAKRLRDALAGVH